MLNQEMLPEIADLALYRSDDTPLEVELLNEDDTPLNLNGCRFVLTARVRASRETVLVLESDDGISVENNKLQVLFSRELTASANWTRAEYDLQMTDTNGFVKTILRGTISLIHDVTG